MGGMEIAALPAPVSRHQRVDGEARIAFGPGGLTDLYQRAPSRLLFPDGARGSFPEAVSLLTSGGLTGGDRARLSILVEADGRATITTQAAERFYRALPRDPDTRVETSITVKDGGACEWLAQEAILFDRARLRRTLHAQLAASSRLLAVESIVLGRSAMGEIFREGLVHDSWRIRRDGRLIWADGLHIDGDFAATADGPFGFDGARAFATILYAGADAQAHLDLARALTQGPNSGATSFDGLLILRFLNADAAALRKAVIRAAGALRAATLGLPHTLPAVWHC
jgi:urease accessory protein